jgi:cellulose synthase/poly-beta-1,6-N-acetylglucosamine synthase-like glycosyltransferase
MPDTFIDFKKQRFRWAYGAMQILREHSGSMLRKDGGLTGGQRYHFLAGWLPWLADGFNLLFTGGAIAWSVAMIVSSSDASTALDPPLLTFSVLPLTLFAFKLMKLIHCMSHASVPICVKPLPPQSLAWRCRIPLAWPYSKGW